jgi:hypothetical protein
LRAAAAASASTPTRAAGFSTVEATTEPVTTQARSRKRRQSDDDAHVHVAIGQTAGLDLARILVRLFGRRELTGPEEGGTALKEFADKTPADADRTSRSSRST